MAAVELAEAVFLAASVAGIVEAGRCRVIPGSVALAECPKGYLVSAHATPALACVPPELSEVVLENGARACLASPDE